MEKCSVCPGQHELNEVDGRGRKQADQLQDILLHQLTSYLARQNMPKSGFWCFRYAASNFARLASHMVLQGHLKENLGCLGANKTLLATNLDAFILCNSPGAILRQGIYLYYDLNDGVFIRSGKVCGRPFSARHQEHIRAARNGEVSAFYHRSL